MNIHQLNTDINSMVSGYLTCALFCDTPEDETAVKFTFDNLSRNALKKAYDDCKRFYDSMAVHNLINKIQNPNYNQLGIDLWYTRNGHGTGFGDNSDKNYNDYVANYLTEIANKFGEVYLYLGDNGKLYID